MLDTYNDASFNSNSPYYEDNIPDEDKDLLIDIVDESELSELLLQGHLVQAEDHEWNIVEYSDEAIKYLQDNGIEYRVFRA